MKYAFILLFSLPLLFSCAAQKITSSTPTKAEWFTNLELAQESATQNQKNILMVFAGSDWCKPCIRFKKDILQSEIFNEKHSSELVVLYLDFPAKKKNKLSEVETKQNETLAEKYNASGAFPRVILFDTAMNESKVLEYNGQSSDAFSNLISN